LRSYVDEHGELLFEVCRGRKPNGDKTFPQRKPNGHGGWTWNTKDVRKVLFRLPEVIEAIANEQLIVLVEGEKDVLNLVRLGINATCNPGGANQPGQQPKWRAEYSETLRGADIVVIPDHDAAGYAHQDAIACMSLGIAKRVRLLKLADHWPGCPQGGDVSDWLAAGHAREELDELIEHEAKPWAPHQEQQATELFDPWQRYAVPAFPLDILPSSIKHFVTTQSEIIGCDKSALAMSVLAAISGALDHRFALKLMRYGNWWASPRLWVLLVGPPSIKKTPIFNAATDNLDRLQSSNRIKYKNDLDEYVKAGGKADDFEMPEPPRYVAYDVTTEKLGMLLGNQDRGLLIKRDELAGWIGSMEKYSNSRGASADRGFWLKAYDGGPYTVDRVSREDVYINNLSCSIIGGIQPARLAELQGLTTDGLLQRFITIMVNGSKLPLDRQGTSEAAKYAQLMHRLINLAPRKLFLADDAYTPMEQLRQHLFDLGQAAGSLHEGFQGFIGKLDGIAGNLALVLAIAGDPDRTEGAQVGAAAVEDASTLVRDFFIPHAFEFYRTADQAAGGDRLQRLASWILTSGKDRIVPSDLTTNVADMRGLGLWDVNLRVSPLVAGGWLTPCEPGPVCKAWTVNPQVHEFFRERAQQEDRRKTVLAELMNSPRTRKAGKS
jgi:hypothetical protein